MRKLRIAIVGAGIGGPTSALFLARQGHSVEIFERVATPGPVGAGILLQPIGQTILNRLGILEQLQARGAPVPKLTGQTVAGRTVLDFNYNVLGAQQHGLGIHRGVLFETLWHALQAAGVKTRTDADITAILDRDTQPTLQTATNTHFGPFDLVIAADGANSQLRNTLDIPVYNKPYPYGALWFIAEDPEQRLPLGLHQTFNGTRQMLGVMSTGLGPEPGTVPLVSMFWSIATNSLTALHAAGLDAWKAQVRQLRPDLDFILAQISDLEQLTFANYYDVVMPRWHQGNVVLIGDAAHAMSPQLGMGANIALVDATILSNCIAEFDTVPSALAAYTARRKPHLRYYQFASRWLTPIFQSNYSWIGPPRDLVFNTVGKLPFFKQQMAGTLAGTKAGILRKIEV